MEVRVIIMVVAVVLLMAAMPVTVRGTAVAINRITPVEAAMIIKEFFPHRLPAIYPAILKNLKFFMTKARSIYSQRVTITG